MIESAQELKNISTDSSEWDGDGPCKCQVSVDRSWFHAGYGSVSVISVVTGKGLDYVNKQSKSL